MTADASRLRLADVSVTLGGRSVLSDVSLDVDARRLGVIGANGSGKSTFARLLNGLVAPTAGRVVVHGLDVAAEREAVRRRVGFIFSSPDAQILMPTVAEDVALSLRGSALSRDQVKERVAGVLEEYGLASHADAPAYSLSGGQKQLLALASVLITRPTLLVADEPTTLLDMRNAQHISKLLLDDLGCDVVLATHDLELAGRCDQVALFEQGRLVDVGEPNAIIATYRKLSG